MLISLQISTENNLTSYLTQKIKLILKKVQSNHEFPRIISILVKIKISIAEIEMKLLRVPVHNQKHLSKLYIILNIKFKLKFRNKIIIK